MDVTIWSYSLYLAISLAITVWVGHTLFTNGRIFIIDAFDGQESLADSVNKLLLVGFYLINIGFVAFFLQVGKLPKDIPGIFEYLSFKIGTVLIVLGIMHFFNVFNFAKMRSKAKKRRAFEASVAAAIEEPLQA